MFYMCSVLWWIYTCSFFSSLVHDLATVYHKRGFVMEITTASITKTKKDVLLSRALQHNLNVLIYDNVYKKRTNAMEFWTATMVVMSWDVVS